MPRQRKPDIDPNSVDAMLKEIVQKATSGGSGGKGRGRTKKFKSDVDRIVQQNDRTRRPMLPEEEESGFAQPPVPTGDPLRDSETPTTAREKMNRMAQSLSFPSWLGDESRSRLLKPRSFFRKKEDLRLRDAEQRLAKSEVLGLRYQTNPIETKTHPESCVCGKDGKCSIAINRTPGIEEKKKKETSRLPVGISKEEEDMWLSNEAADRNIPKERMRDWYEEQKNPSPIRVSGRGRRGGDEPEEFHPLLAQHDHDPRESCDAHGRNPVGHIVYVWNHDGKVPGLSPGFNVCMIVGRAPRSGVGKKSLSPEIIEEHRKICGYGTSHKEGCPIKFHDDNCRNEKHAEGCKIPANTLIDDSREGEESFKVIPWSARPPKSIQEQHNSQIDFNALSAPAPEWKPAGPTGLQGGVTVSSSRCIHVPNAAALEFFKQGSVEGKGDARDHFGDLGGIVGPRSALLTHPLYFENPLSEANHTKNRSLPGYAYILDQLESPKIGEDGPKGVPEGFVRNRPPKKEKTTEESALDGILGKPPTEASVRRAFTHVNENYEQTPSCRFCEDASYKDNKGPIVQTGTAPDGRPLYAHEECDNPFSFAETFKFDFGGPNPVDVDFITLSSHNWGMQYQQDARRINRNLGIVTPSKPADLVDPGFSQPGNKKRIDSMGLPEHEAAESMPEEDPAMETEVNNLNSNGTAKPPK